MRSARAAALLLTALVAGVAATPAAAQSRNAPPAASFSYAPPAPRQGEAIAFSSTSTDRDGTIVRQAWDLDDDGAFDDASGPRASRAFDTAGDHLVRLQVADNRGATSVASRTVAVSLAFVVAPPGASLPIGPILPPSDDVVITFEEHPAGTTVKGHYKPQGVELGFSSADPSGAAGAFPAIAAVPAGEAHSDGQVARTPVCGKEFCSNTIFGRLTQARERVRVWAGGGSDVTLVALDASGNQLDFATKSTGPETSTMLQVTSPAKNIVYFRIGENAPLGNQYGVVAIDDLSIPAPDPNAVPDFALDWLPLLPNLPLGLSKGQSVSTQVHVNRYNGSAGLIDFKIKPGTLPAGVSASFTPDPADQSKASVKLTLSASANASTAVNQQVTVIGKPLSAAAGPAQRTVTIPLSVALSDYNLFAAGLEITQGIQRQETPYYTPAGDLSPIGCQIFPSLPVRDMANLKAAVPYETFKEEPLFPKSPLSVSFGEGQPPGLMIMRRYGGVELAQHEKTIVRFFAHVRSPQGAKVGGVPALLHGSRGGQPLPGSPLSPEEGARDLSFGAAAWVTCRDRARPAGAYTFVLPDSWTAGKIRLRGEVIPEDVLFSPGGECGTQACADDNSYRMKEIVFTKTSYVVVTPVEMVYSQGGQEVRPKAPWKVFADARNLTPVRFSFGSAASDSSYAGVIEITDEVSDPDLQVFAGEMCSAVLDKLADWASEHPRGDLAVGVYRNVCPGVSAGGQKLTLGESGEAVVESNRPRTSVAHELFHGFGRVHASKSCGGGTGGQVGESWDPDGIGHIHGIGLDRRTSPYKVLVPGDLFGADDALAAGQAGEYFDFMSYCADTENEADSWNSVEGWNRTLNDLYKFQKEKGRTSSLRPPSAGAAQAAGAMLRVSGFATAGGVRITKVKPATGAAIAPDPTSPYRLIVRDGAGAVIADLGMRALEIQVDRAGATTFLRVDVPAAGASAVEIARDGALLARRARSASAPRVRVLAPRAGARAGRSASVEVRWRASDADRDELEAKVDFSGDGGRSWQAIFSGDSTGRVALPRALFPYARRARVRVRISDGFNETAATSGVFRALGRPPSVAILSPAAGQRIAADASLYLDGEAYDDRGTRLDGRRMEWRAGRRLLGHGLRLSAARLPAGTTRITLRARDRLGRTARASVRVRVLAATPHLLSLKAPASVARGARSVALRVATTIPATLSIAGRRYAVGRSARRLRVALRPGRGDARLRLRISAGGRTSAATLVIPRR